MRKTLQVIICFLFTGIAAIHADSVSFTWNHNTEPDLAGYRLYYGSQPYAAIETVVIPAGQNRVTVDIPPDRYIWLTAFSTAALESEPTSALLYHPTIVEMVLESADEIKAPIFTPSAGVERWEIFRIPSVLFDPITAEIPSRLNVTRSRIEIITDTHTFQAPIDTTEGQKFFRSFVAVRP